MHMPIGPLTPADEGLGHQIVDTFAVTVSSDPSWTEKVCAMAMARDGSLQLGFGLGKYTNRNVMDAYAGVSRGIEQSTVRASRRLAPTPTHGHRADPLRGARAAADDPVRAGRQRRAADRVRLGLRGVAARRVRGPHPPAHRVPRDRRPRPLPPDRHRLGLGRDRRRAHRVQRPTPGSRPATTRGACATASVCRRPTSSRGRRARPVASRSSGARSCFDAPTARATGCSWYLSRSSPRPASTAQERAWAASSTPTGGVEPSPTSSRSSRRPGEPAPARRRASTCTMTDGSTRDLEIEVLSDTGFHLGAGLYFGFDGHHHGEWRGQLHVDGERIADCTTAETRAPAAPDPRHDRARQRPGRRRRGLGQLAAHRRRRLRELGLDGRHVVHVSVVHAVVASGRGSRRSHGARRPGPDAEHQR